MDLHEEIKIFTFLFVKLFFIKCLLNGIEESKLGVEVVDNVLEVLFFTLGLVDSVDGFLELDHSVSLVSSSGSVFSELHEF